MLEHFELAGLHSRQHVHESGFDAHALFAITFEVMGEVVQHVEALGAILGDQGNAGAFKRFAVAVSRPSPGESVAPGAQRRGMDYRGSLFQPMGASHVNNVALAVPYKLNSRERMVPPEVEAADARPV